MAITISNKLGVTVWWDSLPDDPFPSGTVEPNSTAAITPPSTGAPFRLNFYDGEDSTPEFTLKTLMVNDNVTITIDITQAPTA